MTQEFMLFSFVKCASAVFLVKLEPFSLCPSDCRIVQLPSGSLVLLNDLFQDISATHRNVCKKKLEG